MTAAETEMYQAAMANLRNPHALDNWASLEEYKTWMAMKTGWPVKYVEQHEKFWDESLSKFIEGWHQIHSQQQTASILDDAIEEDEEKKKKLVLVDDAGAEILRASWPRGGDVAPGWHQQQAAPSDNATGSGRTRAHSATTPHVS